MILSPVGRRGWAVDMPAAVHNRTVLYRGSYRDPVRTLCMPCSKGLKPLVSWPGVALTRQPSSPAEARCVPPDEIKGLLPEFAEGALAQQ